MGGTSQPFPRKSSNGFVLYIFSLFSYCKDSFLIRCLLDLCTPLRFILLLVRSI